MERRNPRKESRRPCPYIRDYITMTQDERKHKKFSNPQVTNNIIEVPNWNYQPVTIDHNRHYKEVVRKQIIPFQPEQDTPKVESTDSIGNMRKVIDFALASLRESDKRYHCQVMFEMCERLALCWNCSNHITPEQLYILYEIHAWQCPKTGTKHSIRTPLSLEFKTHIWQGGKLAISNAIPVFNGNLPGEFHWIAKPDYLQAIAA